MFLVVFRVFDYALEKNFPLISLQLVTQTVWSSLLYDKLNFLYKLRKFVKFLLRISTLTNCQTNFTNFYSRLCTFSIQPYYLDWFIVGNIFYYCSSSCWLTYLYCMYECSNPCLLHLHVSSPFFTAFLKFSSPSAVSPASHPPEKNLEQCFRDLWSQ